MNLNKQIKKILKKYCKGKNCRVCNYKHKGKCLNQLLCDSLIAIMEGEKKDAKERI